MLRETFLNTFWACGTVAGVMATMVIAKWSLKYLFARSNDRPRKVEPTGVIDLGATAEPTVPEFIRAEEKVFVGHPAVEATAATELEVEDPIECGNCGKEIKSRRTNKSNPALAVYQCEHCGTEVGVRVG